MTIANILEHWAEIYKPLSHKADSQKLEEQSFFRIRYIDLENIFQRNANVIHSPCMLLSVATTGALKSAKQSEVTHQVWMLCKIKDTAQTLGRFDGLRLEQTANELLEYCEDLAAWLVEVKRTQQCPVSGRSFKADAQLAAELAAIDLASVSYGVMPDIYSGQWLVAGVGWRSVKPLYNFECGTQGKYLTTDTDADTETGAETEAETND